MAKPESKEYVKSMRKARHFEHTKTTCDETILKLSVVLNDTLSQVINTEMTIRKLRSTPDNRIELWEQLKIQTFSRMCTLVYTNTILVIMLRIQLNLIGGYLFKDPKSITSTMQQKYLSMCRHLLLEDGLKKIATKIVAKMTDIVSNVELNRDISLYDVEQIFWNFEVKLSETDDDPTKNIKKYIIPDGLDDADNFFRKIVQETANLLDSEEVCNLERTCTNRGFAHLLDKLSEHFMPTPEDEDSPANNLEEIIHPSKVEIPLAKFIPILNGLFDEGFPKSLSIQLINDEQLQALGSNTYDTYSSKN